MRQLEIKVLNIIDARRNRELYMYLQGRHITTCVRERERERDRERERERNERSNIALQGRKSLARSFFSFWERINYFANYLV